MQVIYPIVKVFLLSGIFSVLINPYINDDLLGVILMTFLCLVLTSLIVYAVGISTEEKKFLISKIHKLKKE
jgi:transposase